MRTTRPDYRDPKRVLATIPDDEPVFILRGQDALAPRTLLRYAELADGMGALEIARLAADLAREVVEYQAEHGSKIPDLPVIEADDDR